ncbi:phosphate ABC transporter permease subunit PstC [Flavobacterium psychrophilum]|uniref:phosphate ABC transporter permease subunit PstC n=1 Tax=Flavobacterium psychrophilum TaxID=96345 RepID=UPI000B7C331D|nr:phosphate ABC transporter permease subunit PstC [Flavobacterium psychrophilum]EKT4552317.1 phosphate ABC transporter permease subunit PstC [Flavobacterium psychrophilum]SNA86138.1 ABC-type phosphate-transport system, permease component PstC [Flavobacterium psychrophilum]
MSFQNPTTFSFTKESLKKQFRWSEFLAEKIISGIAYLSIAIIFLIFVFVFKESLPLFASSKLVEKSEIKATSVTQPETYGAPTEDLEPETYGEAVEELTVGTEEQTPQITNANREGADNTWSSFLTTEWVPVSDNPRFGLIALLLGTLKVTIIAMLFAGPLGVLAALYTSAFASKKAKEIIKPLIELLAAFPSVVIGFFALMILATFFQDVFGYETRLNAFVGGVAMALAAIPIIYTISEDALSAVPKTYTEASLALGASKWQTAFFVTLPAAIPGIFAAILLGIGRVFGETMIALMATGNAALNTASPFESVRTFAATIGSEMAETVFGDTHYSVLFFIGSLLFIFSFGLNALAEFYVKGKLIKKIQGK